MNGWELASAIRNKFGDKIKIVLVSGWSVQEKDKEAYGVDFILQKPFSLSSLESIFLHV
jgi:CheY-like chemotaxis protein